MTIVGDNLVLGASGEYSDFQHIKEMLDDITCEPSHPQYLGPSLIAHVTERWVALVWRSVEDMVEEDGCSTSPAAFHEFLSRVMYNRRTKGDPLWNSLVLGGFKDGERCALPLCSARELWVYTWRVVWLGQFPGHG